MYLRHIHYIIIFTLISTGLTAQKDTNIDSSLNYIKNQKLSLKEMDSLLPILKTNDKKAYVELSEKYVEKAILQKEYEKALDVSIKAFYTINVILGETNRAQELLEKSAEYKAQVKDTFLLGMLQLKRGGGSYAQKNYEEAIDYYSLAIKEFGNTNLLNKADAYFFRGQAYGELGKIKEAIKSLEEAQKIYEVKKDTAYNFYTLGQISLEYERNGLIEEAIQRREGILKKALDYNFKDLTPNYYNLGNLYNKKGMVDKFEESMQNAYKYLDYSVQKIIDKLSIDGALATFYAKEQNLEKADFYYKKLLEAKDDISSNPIYECRYYFLVSKYNYEINNLNEALKNGIKGYHLINNDKRGDQDLKSEFSKLLSDIYAKKNKWDSAYLYSEIAKKIKDSIKDVHKSRIFSYYQTLYETEKKDKEINQKNASLALIEKDNKAKTNLLIYGGTSVFLVLLLGLSLQKRASLKKEKEFQKEFSQKLLSLQEEERKRISKDLHDGLGQRLLFIKNSAAKKKDENLKQLSADAIEEMRNISRSIHPFQIEQMGITYTLNNLVMEYDENSEMMIFGEIDNIDGKLIPEKEINIYRIIQECLTNMVKHSNAQSGKVEVKKEKNKIIISVFDNGQGFSYNEKIKAPKSLGLKTIRERLESINGNMKIISNRDIGSQFTFTLSV